MLARLQGQRRACCGGCHRDLLVNVLHYHPFLIKPNNHELGEIVGRVLNNGRRDHCRGPHPTSKRALATCW
ncbi:MAG: hypothetical protein ACLVJH_11480 [Faecalibacterium prausnitzii]